MQCDIFTLAAIRANSFIPCCHFWATSFKIYIFSFFQLASSAIRWQVYGYRRSLLIVGDRLLLRGQGALSSLRLLANEVVRFGERAASPRDTRNTGNTGIASDLPPCRWISSLRRILSLRLQLLGKMLSTGIQIYRPYSAYSTTILLLRHYSPTNSSYFLEAVVAVCTQVRRDDICGSVHVKWALALGNLMSLSNSISKSGHFYQHIPHLHKSSGNKTNTKRLFIK